MSNTALWTELWTANASHEEFVEDGRPVVCGPVVFKSRAQCVVVSIEGRGFIMYVERPDRHSLTVETKDGVLECLAQRSQCNVTLQDWFFSVAPVHSGVYDNGQNPVLLLLAP